MHADFSCCLLQRCIDSLSVFTLQCAYEVTSGRRWSVEAKRKRLTLDLGPTFQRRLKVIAAIKGVSMRRYCQAAIDKELARDEANGGVSSWSSKPDHELFAELRRELFGGTPHPGSSADLIREAREIRDAEIESWV